MNKRGSFENLLKLVRKDFFTQMTIASVEKKIEKHSSIFHSVVNALHGPTCYLNNLGFHWQNLPLAPGFCRGKTDI